MKVLHIISSSGMYGAEAVILNMSRMLTEAGHTSILGTFNNASNPNLQLHDAAQAQGIDSKLIPCTGQIDRSAIAAIRQLFIRTGATVVHSHGFKADIYVYLALRGRGIPLISTCHTWYDNDPVVTLYGKLDRLFLRAFGRVVAVSEEVRLRLLKAGVRKEKISIVRNGIDLRPFTGVTPSLRTQHDTLIVGLVGRLAWEKGVDVFLQAAAQVLPEFPHAKFIVVGEGPDRDKLEHTSAELNLRDKMHLLGRRDDMPAVYASLDIMVSSSRQEGLPIAILEGMASSLPLVATTVGEVPTVVQEGVTGLLVPPDNIQALAEAILRLLRDRPLREQFGAAARKLVEDEYSAARMTADYLRVYEEAIAEVER